jgi:hypothetical protein
MESGDGESRVGVISVVRIIVIALVMFAVFVIAAARGAGIMYAAWLGFSNAPYPWWVRMSAAAVVLVCATYVVRELWYRERRRHLDSRSARQWWTDRTD